MRRETYQDDPWGRDVRYEPANDCDRDLMEDPSERNIPEETRARVARTALAMLGATSIGLASQACRPIETMP